MAQNPDSAASSLFCKENSNTCFVDDAGLPWDHQGNQDHFLNNNFRSQPFVGFTVYSEEIIKEMVEMETQHLPRDDYLKRLRGGDLDLSNRREALDWICKAHSHYSFEPLSLCLSMNYLDRFLSIYELPKGKSWFVQLLAVACLSLGAKMVESKVPLSVDLQVGEPKFVFEAKTVQRMELLVLSTLKWRMHALTPFSFIHYFLSQIAGDQQLPTPSFPRLEHLLLSTIKGIDFLEFRPSEIAAAVAISLSIDEQTVDIDKGFPCCLHVEKGRVLKCMELIRDLTVISGSAIPITGSRSNSAAYVSERRSPNGVLEAASLSYKTEDETIGACGNSSHNSSDQKRRKADNCRPSHREPKP